MSDRADPAGRAGLTKGTPLSSTGPFFTAGENGTNTDSSRSARC